MEYFVIYLLVMSADLAAGLQALGGTAVESGMTAFLLAALFVCGAAIYSVEEVRESNKGAYWGKQMARFKWLCKWAVALLIIGQLLKGIAVLIPEPKQLAMIIGGGAVYNALTSDTATNLADKVAAKLQERIDQALEADASKPE